MSICDGAARYELIREGSPAYLYFDIEFNKRWNSDLNGDVCMETFEKYLCEVVENVFLWVCDISSQFMNKFFSYLGLRVKRSDISLLSLASLYGTNRVSVKPISIPPTIRSFRGISLSARMTHE
eukprot:746470-Hanusia_phi.AAC.1